jgi:hypothetical protein
MGLGFGILAGAAGAFNAIQGGIDSAKARDDADEDRAYRREQRDNARADRAFGLGQRQRQVDQQQRQDQLQNDLAAVPQTREVDARPQAVREITVDDEGTPSAAAMPAMKTVAAPDWQKFKSTAEAYRKGRDFEKADAYDQLASRAQFADSARRFQTVAAGAGNMSLEQLAQAATDVYNSDPLPAQIKGFKPTAGGLQFVFENADTGQTQTLVVKDKQELLAKLEAYYIPDTYAAAMKAQRDAAIKRQGELEKPEKLGPGDILTSGGRTIAANTNPTEAQIRAAAEAAGGKTGKGGKADDPFQAVTDAWENVTKNSGFKDQATPVQAATSQRLARQFFKESGSKLDPSVAVEAAMDATLNPDKLFPQFDPRSGEIVLSYPVASGGFLVAERLGSPKAPRNVKPEQMRKVAQDFLEQAVPEESRPLFVAAAASPEGKRKLHEEISRRLSTPEGMELVSRELGRPAEEADIERKVQEAIKALKPQLDLLETHLDPKIKQNAKKVESKKVEVAKEGGARAATAERATKLLADKSEEATRELYELQGSGEFGLLDRSIKAAIYERVNGSASPAAGLYQRAR